MTMIVFPMAGLSRRFADAGYNLPKYMLEAHGRSVFSHAVGSFSHYFDRTPFLFILRDVGQTTQFVRGECRSLGISDFTIVVLDGPTSGQAETVALGLQHVNACKTESLTIFNIDTFRPGFRFPNSFDLKKVDGYLEVFQGSGDNWSYVLPIMNGSDRVAETAEKNPISDLCCTGLYHFASVEIFLKTYSIFIKSAAVEIGLKEAYIAPMYNILIRNGHDIRYDLIHDSEVIFCGVPEEYESFKGNPYHGSLNLLY